MKKGKNIYPEVLNVTVEIYQNISRDCVSNICSGNADFDCYGTLHHNRRFSKVSATFVFVMKSFWRFVYKQIKTHENFIFLKDHEMEVRIIWTFIRFINKTDFCTFVKTRCIESENVLVTLNYSILLQRDSKIWWNICWV